MPPRRLRPLVGLLLAGAVAVARAALATVDAEAHTKVAHLACGLGAITVASALYGQNQIRAAGQGCPANPKTPTCHCECGAGHASASTPDATVDVTRKMAPVCDGLKVCDFAVCWKTADSGPFCAKPWHWATPALGA